MRKKTVSDLDLALEPGPKTIGFRLNADAHRILMDRATRLGISPHELARDYLLEALSDRENRAVARVALVDILALTRKLRGDVATAAEAMLVSCGGYTPEEARAWGEKTFT
jgi:hypothetical protein